MAKKKPPTPEPPPGPTRKPLFRLEEIEAPPLSRRLRRQAGTLLSRVQDGERLQSPISEPMRSIGRGVHELRLSDESGEWRIIYRVGGDHVLLVDVFKKTSEQTEDRDKNRSKGRLQKHDESLAAALKAERLKAKKASTRSGKKPE